MRGTCLTSGDEYGELAVDDSSEPFVMHKNNKALWTGALSSWKINSFPYKAPTEGKIDFSQIRDTKQREIQIRGYDADNIGPRFGARHVQVCLIFLCLTVGFAMRTNLSVAIIAMTDNTTSPNPNIHTYDWKNSSVVLSSFFWGYICLQVLAGYWAKLYGAKYFLLPTFFVNSVAFMLIPVSADGLGSYGVMLCRIVQGLTQGFMFPCAHTLLGKWAPAEERGTMGILVYSGMSCGSILSSIVTGYTASAWVGWPASFYIFGALGIVWCGLYLIWGQNTPASHPSITKEERNYIEASLGQSEDVEDIPIPWKSILTSIHLWAIVVANIGGSWGYAMMMTQIPTYLAKVMKFDMKSNGLVSAVPYMVGTISGLIFAPLSDYLVGKQYLTRLNARRVFQLFGAYGLVICLLSLAYTADTKASAVILLAVGNTAYSATLLGYSVNHVDLSPRFSGIMQGISNATSQAIAIFSPLLVQFVVTETDNALQWRTVFIVAAVLYFVCSTFYAIFASASRQKWDGPATAMETKMERMKKQSIISVTGY